jgi:hypothetical protein
LYGGTQSLILQTVHSETTEKGDKSGRVLLLIDEVVNGRPSEDEELARVLSVKLTKNELSVMFNSEIDKSDLDGLRRNIRKLQMGDRSVGKSIHFAVIVLGKVSVTSLDSFNGIYVAEANGMLRVINSANGKTIALENISGARGFGKSQDQAFKDAFQKSSEKISEPFIKRISEAAR